MRNSEFRERLFEDVRASNSNLELFQDRELNYLLFRNPLGCRLSNKGLDVLSALYDTYQHEVTEELSAKEYILLTRHIKYPFYLSKNRIVLFSREDAILLKLYGSVKSWIQSLENTS